MEISAWDDPTAVPGQTYYYWVSSMRGDNIFDGSDWVGPVAGRMPVDDVPPSNRAPVFESVLPAAGFFSMELGETANFSVMVSDPDGDDVSTAWYWRDKAGGAYSHAGNGTRFAIAPRQAGNYSVKAEVTDGATTASHVWDVKVFPADGADHGDLPGSGLVWSVEGATLTISGNGPMPSYAVIAPPYQGYAGAVTRIVVEEGVTHVGDNAFQDFQNVTAVTLPETLSSIGTGAFAGCVRLQSATVPNSVTALGDGVFDGCASLGTLYLPAPFVDDGRRLGVPEASGIIRTDIHAFVKRLYNLCLGRDPDQGGIDGWCTWLANGWIDGANAALGFVTSAEMENLHLSDDAYLEILYMAMMNRPSDPVGGAYWLGALEGGVSRVGVFRGFAESAEFTAICDAFGIVRGSIDPATLEYRDLNVGVTEFVARCYTKALGRGYDVGGLNGWCGYILTSPNPKAAAIWVSSAGFFGSAEFQRRNLPDAAFIEVCYETFLGRGSDPGGLAFWLGQMAGGMDRDTVLQGFASSAEFNGIMGMYGL